MSNSDNVLSSIDHALLEDKKDTLYMVGHNVSGYLPDAPIEVQGWDHARNSLVVEISSFYEQVIEQWFLGPDYTEGAHWPHTEDVFALIDVIEKLTPSATGEWSAPNMANPEVFFLVVSNDSCNSCGSTGDLVYSVGGPFCKDCN